MTTDQFAPYRPLLAKELQRAVGGVARSHVALLRQQIESPAGGGALTPALLCLLTADALGAQPEAATPAAAALALLAQMRTVFTDLPEDKDLVREWGLPRALNAGDAFYALAQDALLRSGLSAERRIEALAWLDQASQGFSSALYDRSVVQSHGAVLAAAVALGALSAGADDATIAALSRPGSANGSLGEAGRRIAEAVKLAETAWQ
jgi:geranylgeranyl diphosphate synthase type I